ncbi:general L-amino acid transport system permease protein [Aestuariispira insulae]|uniref:General L-amino acid transport system permease protein n=1 Tax=Aestuariispira insulae TaxID=1461337 RepID=A0A3D9HWR6_9PROT|nr:general L-amino acid transport system permease protein [Aestuariispira insulae]
MTLGSEAAPAKSSIINDPQIRAIFYQIVALIAVLWFGWSIWDNTQTNMEARGIASGFGFLESTAGFGIIQTAGLEYSEESTYGQAFLVSLINTIIIAFTGVVAATILGFIMGVARLSHNWLIQKLATAYIETFRNIPLLLQIFFWYHAVLKPLPSPRSIYERGEEIAFGINNRGAYMPDPVFGDGSNLIWIGLIVGIIATIVIDKWAVKRQMNTGEQFPVFYTGLGLIIGLPILGYLMATVFMGSSPVTFEYAVMKGFQLDGGFVIIPEFIALFIALSVYTAAFIAENVRSGIQAVSHGQTEAAHALGLRNGPTLRLIVIPQALRVIIPPLTSQYLNLTKNSSLATAIAYPDLVSVFAGTVLNQTGQAVEIIAITMAVYLSLSVGTSIFMNWYNAKMALVER